MTAEGTGGDEKFTVALDLQQPLTAFLAARGFAGGRLCVGLSGGRDSVVLLHALVALRARGMACELSAVHVHHGLSAHADAWASFCADFCRCLEVPLVIARVNVPCVSREGPEAAARRLRHAVFAGCAADWLALAHHRDDQAETVLFRLLRGAGVSGAGGMPDERSQGDGPRLIRPLLDRPRSLIARYAEAHALAWVEDASNADPRYRRNYLRHEVMPRIEAQFPGAAAALARAGRHFAEAAPLLDELAAIDRAATTSDRGLIDLARFNALRPPRARNLLRCELRAAGFRTPEARWLDEALRQLATVGGGSQTCVSTADGDLHVYRGELHVVARCPQVAASLPWRGEVALPWGAGRVSLTPTVGAGIERRLLSADGVFLRSREGGERLQPNPRRPLRTLRKLLQEAAVPPWERGRVPLLWCGERLVWVGGIGVDAAFACPVGEPGLLPGWQRAAPSALAGE
ncbi:MAG: tRNA lysidine(34) synthetase TilS [Candidatus Accumulibacter sp. UW26]|jgi:tRNA(Ile)-lysidine synthase